MNIESAWVEITTRCNLNCQYCYMDANKTDVEFSLTQYSVVIDYLKRNNINQLIISGGEPCLHPLLTTFVELASKNSFDIGVSTNGTLISQPILDCFRKYNVNVQVSIDSMNCVNYELLCGYNKIQNLKTNIEKLVNSGITTSISCTLTDINANQVIDICDFAKSVGISYVHFGPLVKTNRSRIKNINFTKYYATLKKLYFYQLANFYDLRIDLIEELLLPLAVDCCEKKFYCNAMAGCNIQIDSFGNVRQCGLIDSSYAFNIFSCDAQIFPTMLIKPISVDDIGSCSNCEIKNMCVGGCRACAFNHGGDVLAPFPYCQETKKFAKEVLEDYNNGLLVDYLDYLKLMHNITLKNNSIKRLGIY